MEFRHSHTAMGYVAPACNPEPSTNVSRLSQQNFSIPPPHFIPNCKIPPPHPPQGLCKSYPVSPPWCSNSEIIQYNVPFPPKPLPESSTYSQGLFTGPKDNLASPCLNQNINSDERAMDEEWVRQYTTYKLCKSKRVHSANNSTGCITKLKVFEAQLCLEECNRLLQDLESIEKDLMDNIESFSLSEWEGLCQIVELKKLRLVENIRKLSDPPTVESLKSALLKRSKKRAAMKRRRTIQKEEKAATLKRQQQLHLSIDTWLEEMQHSVEKVKVEESLKQQADIVLSDVTRKKAEARRQLALLSMLLKLRRIRVQAASSRGEHTSVELGNIFENVVVKLQKFWSDQLKDYNLEEKGLRVMLEEATEDTAKKTKSLHQRILSEWQRVIFGKNSCTEEGFSIAERDMEEFIKIRHDWDKFVVPAGALMASAMPIGWVLPVKPSSEQWEKLLQTKQLQTHRK